MRLVPGIFPIMRWMFQEVWELLYFCHFMIHLTVPKQVLQLLNMLFLFIVFVHKCTNVQEKKIPADIQQ